MNGEFYPPCAQRGQFSGVHFMKAQSNQCFNSRAVWMSTYFFVCCFYFYLYIYSLYLCCYTLFCLLCRSSVDLFKGNYFGCEGKVCRADLNLTQGHKVAPSRTPWTPSPRLIQRTMTGDENRGGPILRNHQMSRRMDNQTSRICWPCGSEATHFLVAYERWTL